MQVAFALVPGPDGRQWVAWQVCDGQITVTFPPTDPENCDAFADSFAEELKQAAKQAKQANSGLLIPGLNLDPTLLDKLKMNGVPAGVPAPPPPNT